jgi:uncharacterized protein
MHPDALTILRCPLDLKREAMLTYERETLTCDRCEVTYPVKQGLPVLLVPEASLPEGMTELSQLPCQRRRRKSNPLQS